MTLSDNPAPERHPWERAYPASIEWHAGIPSRPLFALLDDAVAEYPESRCLDFLGKTFTYADVGDLVSRAAKGFEDLGVRRGDKVGLLLPNCPYFVVCFFAALKVGATVVPYSPLYAPLELLERIEETGVEVMVTLDLAATYEKLVAVLPQTRLRKVVVCHMWDSLPFPKNLAFRLFRRRDIAAIPVDDRHTPFARFLGNDGGYAPVAIDPARMPAAILYTSGTTGASKGTVLTHGSLYANAIQISRWFTGAEAGRERVLAILPFFHVFGLTAVMNLGVAMAGELILLPRFVRREVLDTVEKKDPTIFCGVPILFRALCDDPGLAKRDFSSIKVCVSGGDALPPDLKDRFETLTGCRLAQGYGLTECGPVVACEAMEGASKRGSVGLPLPQTEVDIVSLEAGRTPLASGQRGEIRVRGPQVMTGYWKRAEATEQALAGGYLYTGDAGYMDDEGYLYVVDRLKAVIVTSGYTVYPRDIENAIRAHGGVADAAVIGIPDEQAGQKVKAFIACALGHQPSEDDIRAFLKDRLAPSEIPSEIEFRDELPETRRSAAFPRNRPD